MLLCFGFKIKSKKAFTSRKRRGRRKFFKPKKIKQNEEGKVVVICLVVCLNALAEKVKAFFSKLHQNFRNDIRLSQPACDD